MPRYGLSPGGEISGLLGMRLIDELFMTWPLLGSHRMTAMLRARGLRINGKRVQPADAENGVCGAQPRPRTTKPTAGHKIYPYQLRNVTIERLDHVWAADITGRRLAYLVAIIDWASRAILAWRWRSTASPSPGPRRHRRASDK